MTTLAGVGTIQYNGFTFAGPRVNTSVSIQPIRDRADRNVTHDIYTITVHAIITSDTGGQTGGTADPETHVRDMEKRLTQDGGQLQYNGLGHGNLEVNTNNINRDCSSAPKTQSLNIKQIGSLYVHEVDWVVRVALKRCTSDQVRGVIGDFKSFLYSINYSADNRGLMTRRISGFYKIVLNRSQTNPPGTRITKTVDDFWEKLIVPTPDRFKRLSRDRTISEDKAQMDFSIVDQEIESDNAYPEGVAEANISHRVSATGIKGHQQNGSIGGSLTMAKPFPVALGWSRVLLIIRERLIHARQSAPILLTRFSITEPLFERKLDFDVQYKFLATKDLSYGSAVGNHGLFRPIKSTSFGAWSRSMTPTAWHPRGTSRLRHNASSDTLVSVCDSPGSFHISDRVQQASRRSSLGKLSQDCPPRKNSYLTWQNWITLESQTNRLIHRPMQVESGRSSDSPIRAFDDVDFGQVASNVPNRGVVVEEVGTNEVIITMTGHGVRAGYKVEVPDLIQIFNRKVNLVPDRMGASHTVLGDLGGCRVYAAKWMFRYRVKNISPSEIQDLLRGNLWGVVISTKDDKKGKKLGG